ncbi:carbohydrate ABC transporter permease [Microbispora sp. H10830]|uniref:carbohydrate ABC transporter permease n=1 Tax=Microbispora sp. H10830 TaxID=2729109 RepID=UPI001C719A4E|nr:carbohydrate ABC transporter permease [Microbispora sp. H10830]
MRPSRFYRPSMYLCGALLAAVVLGPFALLLLASVSPQAGLLGKPPDLWPDSPTLDRYAAIFTQAAGGVAGDFRVALVNSLVVAGCSVAVSLVTGVLGAYAFARLRFPGRRLVLFVFMLTYMMPPLALVVPMYMTGAALGLLDTRTSLVVVYCSFTTPFVLWLLSGYFRALPAELEEAARIDGCGRVGALIRVVLPVARPGLISAGLLAFLMAWDEFFYALIFTSSPASKTVPVALAEFTGRYSLDFGLMAAGGLLAAVPPVLIALIFQKHITRGLAAGAVK